MKKLPYAMAASLIVSLVPAFGDDEKNDKAPQAEPFVFVGSAGDCGGTAGSSIVTSAWLPGIGLPDDGKTLNPDGRNPHLGLLLSKNGPTANCSAAGATITGVAGLAITATTEFGFDYRNGGHCGAGAPRFNVIATDNPNITHFAGCVGSTHTPAPQDKLEWTRIRLTPSQFFPPLVPGSKIKSVSIIFEEGTDTSSVDDPLGVGLAVVDNIDVNGELITSGNNRRDNGNDDPGDKDKKDEENTGNPGKHKGKD